MGQSQKQEVRRHLFNLTILMIAICYISVLLKIVMFKYGFTSGMRSLNVVPFTFLRMFSGAVQVDVALKNILGNVAVFVPLGVIFSYIWKRASVWRPILACLGVSILFEAMQWIIGCGATVIDDIILNALGSSIGVAIYQILLLRIDQKIKMPLGTIGFFGVFGICGVLSLYLYAPNILPAQVEYRNQEMVEELESRTLDVDTRVTEVQDNVLVTEDGQYEFAEQVRLIKKKMSYKFSPNGNIQKTIVTYSEITSEELKGLLIEESRFGDLYLNETEKCEALIVTEYE